MRWWSGPMKNPLSRRAERGFSFCTTGPRIRAPVLHESNRVGDDVAVRAGRVDDDGAGTGAEAEVADVDPAATTLGLVDRDRFGLAAGDDAQRDVAGVAGIERPADVQGVVALDA